MQQNTAKHTFISTKNRKKYEILERREQISHTFVVALKFLKTAISSKQPKIEIIWLVLDLAVISLAEH